MLPFKNQRVHETVRSHFLPEIGFHTRALVAAALLMAPPSLVQAKSEGLPAPYQINGALQPFDDGNASRRSPFSVLVDLGRARDRPPPDDRALPAMTVIGTEGFAALPYGEIHKHCSYLCGTSEGETCHYVGIYDPQPNASLGIPLAAIETSGKLYNFSVLVDLSEVSSPAEYDPEASDSFFRPRWDAHGTESVEYRISAWDPKRRGFTLETRWSETEPVAEDLSDCRVVAFGGLDFATCRSRSVILHQGRPLVVDFPDYNAPSARPIAAFDHQGIGYILFELGLKAQTVYGLLFESGQGWQARVRPRDYPSLC